MSPSATSKSRYKLPYFVEEHLQNDEVYIPYIALTETWLKSFITDAQIAIENYHTVRADRKNRERGGTMMYIHDNVATTEEDSYDNDKLSQKRLSFAPYTGHQIQKMNPSKEPLTSYRNMLTNIPVTATTL